MIMKFSKTKFFYSFDGKIIEFLVSNEVYYPQEDSIFFADSIIEYFSNHLLRSKENLLKIKNILEIGCGCGLLSIILYKFFEKQVKENIEEIKFFAVDINKEAVKNTRINARRNGANIITKCSNLFENIRDEKFDLIIFNAPYLPVEEDYSYSVFQNGKNILNKFLKDAKEFINLGGTILLLVSSITPIKIPREYNVKIIKRKKIDWEELLIYEIKF